MPLFGKEPSLCAELASVGLDSSCEELSMTSVYALLGSLALQLTMCQLAPLAKKWASRHSEGKKGHRGILTKCREVSECPRPVEAVMGFQLSQCT